MINVEKLDDELYRAFHNNGSFENALKLWSMIKGDPTILREAVQVKKDKFGERDIVRGIAIASTMLMDFENVDEEAYDNLIDAIYTNKDIFLSIINGKNLKVSKYMKKAIKTFKNMEQYILNAFDYEYSNGIVEGTNNVIKQIKHIACGYRKFKHLKARIMLIKGLLNPIKA